MNYSLLNFDRQLRESISRAAISSEKLDFKQMALALFALQYECNEPYRRFCNQRGITPAIVSAWNDIPAIPVSAFKQLELTSIPASERSTWFESSRTTHQQPSRHHHNESSLGLYAHSLLAWFQTCLHPYLDSAPTMLFLTPLPNSAPHSSLVYMFEVLRQRLAAAGSCFAGHVDQCGAWGLDFIQVVNRLEHALKTQTPLFLLGTAFNFVHLLDYLADRNLVLRFPPGSMALETGGYKNRARAIPKDELHSLIAHHLNIPKTHLFSEYGMCELSSQAYDVAFPPVGTSVPAEPLCAKERSRRLRPTSSRIDPTVCGLEIRDTADWKSAPREIGSAGTPRPTLRLFRFPPWVRLQIISPESGRPLPRGETGLIRVFDLANVYSVMAVQTEDLGIEYADGFELIGRNPQAEPRGCSLMSATT